MHVYNLISHERLMFLLLVMVVLVEVMVIYLILVRVVVDPDSIPGTLAQDAIDKMAVHYRAHTLFSIHSHLCSKTTFLCIVRNNPEHVFKQLPIPVKYLYVWKLQCFLNFFLMCKNKHINK